MAHSGSLCLSSHLIFRSSNCFTDASQGKWFSLTLPTWQACNKWDRWLSTCCDVSGVDNLLLLQDAYFIEMALDSLLSHHFGIKQNLQQATHDV